MGIVQEIKLWPCELMVYAQARIRPGEWDKQTPQGFWDTNGLPNLGQTTRPCKNQQQQQKKKKRICRIMDFPISADHRIKVKGSEKKDKKLNLARELKKTMELESDGDN